MTASRGHCEVVRVQAPCAAAIAYGSKGGNASLEQDAIVPLGNEGRLRPPLFYAQP
jgi:hypothetical protein